MPALFFLPTSHRAECVHPRAQLREGGAIVRSVSSALSVVEPVLGLVPTRSSQLEAAIVDERGSKTIISDKDVSRFQTLAEMRSWSRSFSKRVNLYTFFAFLRASSSSAVKRWVP